MSRISEEQQQWIESLKCERLSCNEENRDHILLFNNTKNEALASYLYERHGTMIYLKEIYVILLRISIMMCCFIFP